MRHKILTNIYNNYRTDHIPAIASMRTSLLEVPLYLEVLGQWFLNFLRSRTT